jgi:death on curing protein
MTRYLTAEEILIIHAKLVDETGGSHGVRDIHRIGSMIDRPKQQFDGKELYPSLFEKAAVYFEISAYHHPFIDGNKRTAITLAARFLFINGFKLVASNSELEKFVLDAVGQKYNIARLAEWFKKYSKKYKK